jgi:ribosome-interacting GTPase 1
MRLSKKMKDLMNKLDLIGKKSLPLCKHENTKISNSAIEINQLAQEIYKELDRMEHNFRHEEQGVNTDEPIVRFL